MTMFLPLAKRSSDVFGVVEADGGKDLRVVLGGGGGRLRHEVNVERPSRKMEECGDALRRATSGPLFPSSSTCLTTSFLFIPRQQSPSQHPCMANSGGWGGRLRSWMCSSVRALQHTGYLLFTCAKLKQCVFGAHFLGIRLH